MTHSAENIQPPLIHVKISSCPNYSLLDSGEGWKLEEFSGIKVIRPEPKAWWKKELPDAEWKSANSSFNSKTGKWNLNDCPLSWNIDIHNLKFELRLNDNSKHTGIFPEQEPHWSFINTFSHLAKNKHLLNLFGYTGAATIFALNAGFKVTHVDASAPAISWAKKNAQLNNLSNKPVRWILDDAVKFLKREIRRNVKYDAIILDPPAFGRGPKGEIWKLESSLYELLSLCKNLFSSNPLFLILTIYNIEASPLMPANLLSEIFKIPQHNITCGELTLQQKNSHKLLPLSIYNSISFLKQI